MTEVTILHNPRCSKSRQTLQLLRDRGIEPVVVDYLKTPPDVARLADLVRRLGISPHALLRRGEAAYREAGLDRGTPSDEQVLQAIHEHPILMQRPIVVVGERAALGRPPENVLQIL